MRITGVLQSIITLLAFLCLPPLLNAQPPADPGGNPDVPFDLGLSILVVAGLGYAAKKKMDARKKERVQQENGG